MPVTLLKMSDTVKESVSIIRAREWLEDLTQNEDVLERDMYRNALSPENVRVWDQITANRESILRLAAELYHYTDWESDGLKRATNIQSLPSSLDFRILLTDLSNEISYLVSICQTI